MKNLIVVIVFAVVLIAGVLLVRPKVQEGAREVKGLYSKVEWYVTQAERMWGLLEVTTEELDRVTEQRVKDKEIIKEHEAIIKEQEAEIDRLEAEKQEVEYDIPEIPDTTPDDLEECIQELQRSRETSSELIEVVQAQREQGALKMATIQSQGIIIESQAEIITRQSDYIDEFETLIEQHQKRSKRNILIGVAVGIAAGLFI